MKILVKITSLALLTLCLQVDAANANLFRQGPDGFVFTCQFSDGAVKKTNTLKQKFLSAYGVGSDICTPANVTAVRNIQAFVTNATKFNQATQAFIDDAAVQEFVSDFADSGNLLGNRAIFSTDYLKIARTWLEEKVKSEATQAAALQDIATSVATVRTPGIPAARLNAADIVTEVRNIDIAEASTREWLNNNNIKWNNDLKEFETNKEPEATVGGYYLESYMRKTFAKHLQKLLPIASDDFSKLLSLIQTNPPFETDKLNPNTNAEPRKYFEVEAQADAVITAMGSQIDLTNEMLENAVHPALVQPGTLSQKTQYVIAQLAAGGSAGIETYLDSFSTIPNPLVFVTPELAVFQDTIDATRTALNYGTTNMEHQFEVIRDILKTIPPLDARATAEDKVKNAINYLTKQLYTSFMWLTMAEERTSADGIKPLTFAKVQNVPAYDSGGANNVAAAAQNRITTLISTIKNLSIAKKDLETQNAALTTAVRAVREDGDAAGAETDDSVISVTTQVETLATQLIPCNAVKEEAALANKLPLLPVAVIQMADALTKLSAGVPAGLPAVNGATLATVIRNYISDDAIRTNPAAAQLATAQANVIRLNSELAAAKAATTAAEAATTAKTRELEALPKTIAANLVSLTGGIMFHASSFGVNNPNPLDGLTIKALDAQSTLADVGNYLRQCAEAAYDLKTIAGIKKPASMATLIRDSLDAIRAKIAGGGASLPADQAKITQLEQTINILQAKNTKLEDDLRTAGAGTAGAGTGAGAAGTGAGTAAAEIDDHNTSVKRVIKQFNKLSPLARKASIILDPISTLNATAITLNATSPATKALTIKLTNDGVDVTGNKDKITAETIATEQAV